MTFAKVDFLEVQHIKLLGPIQSACYNVFKKNVESFDNCLINEVESQNLNISQLEFSANKKGDLF